jgi:glycosyltransferase involved in cell wall biosynthesis
MFHRRLKRIKMRIYFEARWITFEKTGFGNYAQNLLKELFKINSKNQYCVYLNQDITSGDVFNYTNVTKIVLTSKPELYKHARIPFDIACRGKPDLFHFLYNAPSLIFPWPKILTIHDMSYMHIPFMISKKNFFSIILLLKLHANSCKHIITVSENSKRDIIRFLKVDPEKISVIYEGFDTSFFRNHDVQRKNKVFSKYDVNTPYILYVGTYLPHKNLPLLLSAFKKLIEQKGIQHTLVLAGKKGNNFDKTFSTIEKLQLSQRVKCIGYVDDKDLPALYSGADCFVYPSLYEGFGLPLLEAMACGVPVVSSDSSCLPEIGGKACKYFRATDVDSCVSCMDIVLRNLETRKEMIESGYKNLNRFSWADAASKTLQCYDNCLKVK